MPASGLISTAAFGAKKDGNYFRMRASRRPPAVRKIARFPIGGLHKHKSTCWFRRRAARVRGGPKK